MPVTIKTSDRSRKRGKIVHGAKVERGTEDSSAVKNSNETFVCGTCAEMIGRVEIEGDCGATLVVCPTPILRQWQDEISRSFSTLLFLLSLLLASIILLVCFIHHQIISELV